MFFKCWAQQTLQFRSIVTNKKKHWKLYRINRKNPRIHDSGQFHEQKKKNLYWSSLSAMWQKGEYTNTRRNPKNNCQEENRRFLNNLNGDFNAVMNPRKDRFGNKQHFTLEEDSEIPLLSFLSENGYIDIQEAWEGDKTSPTWHNHNSSSRIDHIWTTQNIALEFTEFQNKQIQEVTASDHTMLKMITKLDTIIHRNKNSQTQHRSKTIKLKQ